MPNNTTDLIKTVAALPWDGVVKLLLLGGLAFFFYGEYKEDNQDEVAQSQEADTHVLFRDLLVAIRADQGKSETQEELQDLKIERLEENHPE